MSRTPQRLVAAVVAVTAGLVLVAAAGWLTVDAFAVLHQAPRADALVKNLVERTHADATYSPLAGAEYERHTAASLARERRNALLNRTLLAAAALFLIGTKSFLALRRAGPAPPRQVLFLCQRSTSGSAPGGSAVPAASGPGSGHQPLPIAEAIDLSPVDKIVARTGRQAAATIPILQAIQAHYRYLPDAALRRVCALTEITPAQLAGVASFYTQFRRTPIGEHVLTVCHGTACHVAGATRISDELRRRLNIPAGTDTDAGRRFTIQEAPCLGCCTLAPVVRVDGVTRGHTDPESVAAVVEAVVAAGIRRGSPGADRLETGPTTGRAAAGGAAAEIRIGLGSCCVAGGSGAVYDALWSALAAAGVNAVVKPVGCVGMCHQTPFIEITRHDGGDTDGDRREAPILYSRVTPEQADGIIRRHFRPRALGRRLRYAFARPLTRLRFSPPRVAPPQIIELRNPPVAAFLGRQVHIATEHCGELDPLDLDEYVAHDGFKALRSCRAQDLSAEQIIEQLRHSGLRGRGGAGYPTWQKWARVRAAPGETKYAICNGDEGDPGAFMDRMLMESYPYRVIEGLAIAALAVGATESIFYIRAEYPLAVERITEALRRCAERGILGRPGTDLHVRVFHGAGAFVCGEETALIASLEGQRGTPRLRPPYPAEEGLWGQPTLVNNVETLAVVPWILRHGPAAYAALGTPASKGTKVFALAGKIRRGGLIEVPMGITIRQIVAEIGGGIRDEQTAAGVRHHAFKAVQIGGPSGGCIPAALADTPVDYEALTAVGALMGSGGLVVLDETDCMVDIARYFLSFTQSQSCGQCAPCRVGTRRMLEILDRLCSGGGRPDDLATLEHLARTVNQGSLCGLGKTAPHPVLTTLRYFRDEYEAHLQGRCPAGKCKALVRYVVTDACTGCTLCAQHCPVGAIGLRPYERHEIDVEECTRCDVCRICCPEDAIRVV